MLRKLVALIAVMFATAGFSQESDWQQGMFSKGPYVCSINLLEEEASPEENYLAFVSFRDEPYFLTFGNGYIGPKHLMTFMNKGEVKTSFYIVDDSDGAAVISFKPDVKISNSESDETASIILELNLLHVEDGEWIAEGWCQLAPKLD